MERRKGLKNERNAGCRGISQTADVPSAEGYHPAQSGWPLWDSLVAHCLLSTEPCLVTPHGATVRLSLSLKHFVQAFGEISEKFTFGVVLL